MKQIYEYIVNFNKVMCAVEKKKESDYLYIDKLYIDKNNASITVNKMKNDNKSEMFFFEYSTIIDYVIRNYRKCNWVCRNGRLYVK